MVGWDDEKKAVMKEESYWRIVFSIDEPCMDSEISMCICLIIFVTDIHNERF